MKEERVLDDLRAIREVMERTRRASGGQGGWFMILWGVIWFLGFAGTHFLLHADLPYAVNWLWAGLNGIGIILSTWLGVRFQRHAVRSTLWRAILLWWLALAVFDGLLIWLFGLTRGEEIVLLIILTVALGYVLFGLFSHWAISLIGLFFAALSVVMSIFLPAYFNLAFAFLGGGILVAGGAWFVRQEGGR